MSVSVLHFINPYPSDNPKEQRIQQLTIESIQKAVSSGTQKLEVTLGAVLQEGHQSSMPKDMLGLPVLKKSVLDVVGFVEAPPYPLISEIMTSAKSHLADYYIYSNMDIGLMPNFYEFVSQQIHENGHDALIINRRRLPENLLNASLKEIYEEDGKPHPGFDCFVMSRAILEKLVLGNICVGIPFVGVALAHNIFAHADKPKLIDRAHLTFHLGMEIFPPRHKKLYWYNRREFFGQVAPVLWPDFDLDKFPHRENSLLVRLLKWVKNPSLFTLFFFRLLHRKWFHIGNK